MPLPLRISFCILVTLALAVSLDVDVQVCLNCWNVLCGTDGVNNIEQTCPCPCVNSTLPITETKCNQSGIANEPTSDCCPKANQFVAGFIEPALQSVNFTNISECSVVYNSPLTDNLNDYDGLQLDREYIFYTPFTCSGYISNVTIYHRFAINNKNLTVQLWRTHRNITDNTTVLMLATEQNITFYQTDSSSWGTNNMARYTVGFPSTEIHFVPGDIFGVYVPTSFTGINIYIEKVTLNSQFYSRRRPNCQSLRDVFYLSNPEKRPAIEFKVVPSDISPSISPSSSTSSSLYLPSSPNELSSVITISSVTTEVAATSAVMTTSNVNLLSSTSLSSSNTFSSTPTMSSVIVTSTPSANSDGVNLIYVTAGAVIVAILLLIVVVLILICVVIGYTRKKGQRISIEKPVEMQPDQLDFQTGLTTNSHGYRDTAISASNSSHLNERNGLVDSMVIHDYDLPTELSSVPFNRSRETLSSSTPRHHNDERDYTTMMSNVRTNTPSSVSNASDNSRYSQPRPVNSRYQSPSTNQRYDSPRSIAASSTSEYDDPTRVLEKTPRFNNKFLRPHNSPGKEATPDHHFSDGYREPTPTQGMAGPKHYHVLENPNEETGQAERNEQYYFELEPPTSSLPRHYHVLEEGSGYHVPTKNDRLSMMLQGDAQIMQTENQFFLNKPVYYEPPEGEEHIYAQLNQHKCREIPLANVTMERQLGEGQFGTVFSGTWHLTGGMMKAVAIKRLKPSASAEDRARFLREGARMMQFFHANVVKLHGVVTLEDPPLLIQELMREGDLKSYLKSSRPAQSERDAEPTRLIPSPQQLLKFGRDIASGMRHLAHKKFVHRDLAARNVLLNDSLICKIADFGMTRAAGYVFDLSKLEQIPLRWTAPEAFNIKQYSEWSDVYSYGMVLFEIWSLGRKPFPMLRQNQEIINYIAQKRLMPPPPGCPRTIYHLMVKCWNPLPSGRLTFDSICNDYYSANDESLLTWEKDDVEGSPRASEIGAPLGEGFYLYTDLQHEYREN